MQARTLVLTLAVFLASLPGSVGKDADLDLYPDPRNFPDACGRTGLATSLVCDPSSVLVQDEADRVDVIARSPSSPDCPLARDRHGNPTMNPGDAGREGRKLAGCF